MCSNLAHLPCYLSQIITSATSSHLPEFERRTQGTVRGDAKKFALEKAADFIATFGLPNEFIHVEEAEPRFKEVCLQRLDAILKLRW